MNILLINARVYRPPFLSVIQSRGFSTKVNDFSSSPLVGSPRGLDINNLDSYNKNRFADVYQRAEKALEKDFYTQSKKFSDEEVQKLFMITEKEIQNLKEVIDVSSERTKEQRDFIQIGLDSVQNQLHFLSDLAMKKENDVRN